MNEILLLVFFMLMVPLSSFAQSYVYPKNNQVLSDTSIIIQWDELPGASSYHLQVSSDILFQSIIVDSNNIISSEVNINLYNGVYYSRIKSNATAFSSVSKFIIFSPKVIDSLVLWLSADSGVVAGNNNKVSQWNDLSGHNNNAIQSSSLKQPLLKDSIIGENPSVSFIGGSSIISGAYSNIKPNNKNRSLFLLLDNQYTSGYNNAFVNFNAGISYKYLELSYYNSKIRCWVGNGLSYDLKTLNGSFSGTKLSSIIINNSAINAYLNGIKSSSANSNYFVDSIFNFAIGGRTSDGNSVSQSFNGQVFEIIDYAKPLDSIETQLVSKYVLDKYTPPVNIGQNIMRRYGFSDTVIATAELYDVYLWSNGDTIREINLSIEDTGWFWCDVPNLYGEIIRDSVYVYGVNTGTTDTLICFGDTISVILPQYFQPFGEVYQNPRYTYEWKNSQNQTISVDSFIQIYEEGVYYLKITDTLNYSFYDTMFVEVDSFQLEATLGPDQSLCTGDKIGLISGQAKADSFLWSTGNTDSLLTINSAGIYSVIVIDTNSCIAKDTIYVDIHGVTPLVSFYADTVCLRDSTIFIDQSQSLDQSNLILWDWEFGDGSSLQSPLGSQQLHLLPDSGSYIAKLTVSTDSNCSNYTYKDIYIRPLPEPNFYPLTGCQNIEITFSNLTTHQDSITSFFWNFGNGDTEQQTINNKQQTYTYNQAGPYNTLLRAIDINGCTDSITQQVNILPSPFADFTNSISCEGTPISFIDNSTTLSYNSIQTWKWNFDTINLSVLQSPTYLFDSAGFYPISLKVVSINNCWDSISKTVKLHSIPQASFSFDTACMNNYFNLNNLSSIDNDIIKYYYWYSDGQGFDTIPNTSYKYKDTLSHQILFRVKTNALCEDSIIKTIKSHPLPNADFTTDKEYGLPPLVVNFINNSTNNKQQTTNNLIYLWSFGDGSLSTIESPTYTYQDSAIFHPQLKATNQFGCWDTISYPIYAVYAAIDVAITSIRAEVNNGYISYSCTITNYGKQKLKELNLFAKYNSGVEITEKWTGELLMGESIVYYFNSETQVNNNEQIRYYCIRVDLTEDATQEDENPSNNSLCKDLSNDFWLSSIYPNPVNDIIQFDVVLPYSEDINIQISNAQGLIIQKYIKKGVKGLNQMSINIQALKSGQYYLHLEYKDGFEVRTFIVL